ncbi:MAG: hypothetical protein ACRBF0_19285 [Calditrichia bacterium]
MQRISRALPFYLALYGIVTAMAIWIIQSSYFRISPDALSLGLTLDLTLLLPAAYFFLARRSSLPVYGTLPVFILSFFLASYLLPADRQNYLAFVEIAVIPLELGILFLVGREVKRTLAILRNTGRAQTIGFREHAQNIISNRVDSPVVASIMATELSMFYYALNGWRTAAEKPDSSCGFSYHKRNAYASIVGVVFVLVIVESVAAHLLIAHWSPILAWGIHFLGLYAMLFIFADYFAVKLRPLFIHNNMLHLRLGFRWACQIPLEQIERVELTFKALSKAKNHLDATLMGTPNLILHLSSPVNVSGLYGMQRKPDTIQLSVDEPGAFKQALDS